MRLPDDDRRPDSYRVQFSALPWLTSNQRGGWQRYHRLIRDWRRLARYAAVGGRVPPLGAAHVFVELRFRDKRRRDPANWAPTAKAIVDGLVDADVIKDDSSDYLVGPDLRVGPTISPRALVNGMIVVHIFPLGGRR